MHKPPRSIDSEHQRWICVWEFCVYACRERERPNIVGDQIINISNIGTFFSLCIVTVKNVWFVVETSVNLVKNPSSAVGIKISCCTVWII